MFSGLGHGNRRPLTERSQFGYGNKSGATHSYPSTERCDTPIIQENAIAVAQALDNDTEATLGIQDTRTFKCRSNQIKFCQAIPDITLREALAAIIGPRHAHATTFAWSMCEGSGSPAKLLCPSLLASTPPACRAALGDERYSRARGPYF